MKTDHGIIIKENKIPAVYTDSLAEWIQAAGIIVIEEVLLINFCNYIIELFLYRTQI